MVRKAIILSIVIILFLSAPAAALEISSSARESANPVLTPIDSLDFPHLYLREPNLEGESIWMVQARLRELGYDIEPDGKYSYHTCHCVRLFQLSHGLKDDGVVTPEVWQALMGTDPAQPCISEEDAEAPRMLIVIDVDTRNLVVYQDDKEIRRYPVAVGKSKTPTPLGEWTIVHKGVGWGNGFGTRWLGLNVPWGIFGIHGTNKPYSIGSYASHGCIRMFNRDVEKLYPLIPMGTVVRIVDKGKMFPADLKPVPLKKGSSGQRVVYVQSRLKELGIELDKADGRYGNMTELAVKYYQVWHNLNPSGEMDEATYRAMGMIE